MKIPNHPVFPHTPDPDEAMDKERDEAVGDGALKSAMPRQQLIDAIESELDRAYLKHGRAPWSRHEFYAILLEEVDELWDTIKHDEPRDRIRSELIQVAAMCFRFWETSST